MPRLTRRQWSTDTSKTLSGIRDKKISIPFSRPPIFPECETEVCWTQEGRRNRARAHKRGIEMEKFSKGGIGFTIELNHFVTRLLSTEECWINNFFFEGLTAWQRKPRAISHSCRIHAWYVNFIRGWNIWSLENLDLLEKCSWTSL